MSPKPDSRQVHSNALLAQWRGGDELAGRVLVCRHHAEVFARVASQARTDARGALIRAVFRELRGARSPATFADELDAALARVLARQPPHPLGNGPLSETVDHVPPTDPSER